MCSVRFYLPLACWRRSFNRMFTIIMAQHVVVYDYYDGALNVLNVL